MCLFVCLFVVVAVVVGCGGGGGGGGGCGGGVVWCGVVCVVCNMATMLIHQVRLVQSSQCPAGPACFVLYSSFTIFYFSTDV